MGYRMLAVAMLVLTCGGFLRADVTMPAIFGDHMVLQQDTKLPVWGTAGPGEKVTVTVGDKTGMATADANGAWRVDLAPLPATSAPVTMTVAGKNTLTFSDVLVGDVWICSGQSNMEFALTRAHNAASEQPKANDPQLRLFLVSKPAEAPQKLPGHDAWMVCTPDNVKIFSAVGYFFGRDLRANLNRPIGLIGSYFGGTPVEAWTGPVPRNRATETKQATDVLDQREADFPKAWAAYLVDYAKWYQDTGAAFDVQMKDWNVSTAKAKAAGQPLPPRPQPAVPMPRAPGDPGGAGGLFTAMVRPLLPYGIKGAIWYQGEANTGRAPEYHQKFSDLITRWRAAWGEGDFPFLFVQLAAYEGMPNQDWPQLREAQLKTLALPNTGMATAVDIGSPKNVHPEDKMDVGDRLALAARHVAYGQELVYSGPIYDAMKVEGGAIRVSFTQIGGGLVIGSAPWVAKGWTPLPTDKLPGFSIAGADKNWFPADAKIDANSVVVSSSQVAQPVAVRYAWANVPQMNLYNKEGLPASPFRTDDWPSTGFYSDIAALAPVPGTTPTPPASIPASSTSTPTGK